MLKTSQLKAPGFNGPGLGHWWHGYVAGPSFRQARSTTETYKSPSMTGTDDERGAFFIKDVIDPLGSASISATDATSRGKSSSIDAHTQTEQILVYRSEVGEDGQLTAKDEYITLADEPDHDKLCRREQVFFLDAIQGRTDLTEHQDSAIRASEIILAADESFRPGDRILL